MRWIILKKGMTSTASAPAPTSDTTDGIAIPPYTAGGGGGVSRMTVGCVRIASTAGSGAMAIAGRMWLHFEAVVEGVITVPARWVPAGSFDDGTDTKRGMLNGGNPIGKQVTAVDQIDYVEQLSGFDLADRIAFEATTLANGTFDVVFGAEDLTRG